MSDKQEKSYSADLLAGGVGLFLGVLLSMVWRGLPTWSASGGVGGTVVLFVLFAACHYTDTNDGVQRFMDRFWQVVIGVAEGLLLMMTLFHP